MFGNGRGRVHPIGIARIVNGDTGRYSDTLEEPAHGRREKREDAEEGSDQSFTGMLAHVRYYRAHYY